MEFTSNEQSPDASDCTTRREARPRLKRGLSGVERLPKYSTISTKKKIRHADLSGRNLLIDLARGVLLCDFAGSSIDDDQATVVAETGFRHPDEREYRPPTIRAEIHALGSTIYEIVTGRKPFHEKTEEQEREVEKLMEEGKYPDVSELPLGDVIVKCWKREGYFTSAADVAEEIARSSTFSSRC